MNATRRIVLAFLVALTVAGGLLPLVLHAQVSGFAFATWHDGNVFEGFVGPARVTPTGVDFNFVILCVDTATRNKRMNEQGIAIPDGTTLPQLRTLITTGAVEACAAMGITVPRGAVVLPTMQFGN